MFRHDWKEVVMTFLTLTVLYVTVGSFTSAWRVGKNVDTRSKKRKKEDEKLLDENRRRIPTSEEIFDL